MRMICRRSCWRRNSPRISPGSMHPRECAKRGRRPGSKKTDHFGVHRMRGCIHAAFSPGLKPSFSLATLYGPTEVGPPPTKVGGYTEERFQAWLLSDYHGN